MTIAQAPEHAYEQLELLANVDEREREYIGDRPSEIVIAGRQLRPTAVFDTYWRFAAKRQKMYEARQSGAPAPWTSDPILRQYRFTNCYRAADRVSQFLIAEVIYKSAASEEDVFFRTLLFKFFNRVGTWRLLREALGEPSWADYSYAEYNAVLSAAFAAGQRLYSPAYVVPPPALGEERKHSNHLRLLELMMKSNAAGRLVGARSMSEAFSAIVSYPAIGGFLGYQYLVDLNYSEILQFDEMDFVVAGPGARDGIRKSFGPESAGIESDIIRYMAEHQDEHFARLNLAFKGLRSRRLQLIDCQNLFCEVDKYSRVAHPDVAGYSGRTRIKQHYRVDPAPIGAWFPPKWGINDAVVPAARTQGPGKVA